MATGIPTRTLVMYVASEPGLHANIESAVPGFTNRLATLFVPFSGLTMARGVSAAAILAKPGEDLGLVARQCIRLVLDVANKKQWSVQVVDLSQQKGAESQIQASFGYDVHLPVLVRPDGARLMGEEEFTPGRIRKFLTDRPRR